MKSPFCILIIILVNYGCSPLQNKVDDSAVTCGVPAGSQKAYLQFISPSGETYTDSLTDRLQVNFLSQAGQKRSLPVSRLGCVEQPAESGFITVVDAIARASRTVATTKTNQANSISTANLHLLQDFALTLNCPATGLFADSSLPALESLNLNGDALGVEYQIDLYSRSNQFIREIYRKPLGQEMDPSGRSISVSDLPEGEYILKLYGRHVANGLNAEIALLQADRPCSLFVLHGSVNLKDFHSSHPLVIAKGSVLPWKPAKAGQQLYMCRDTRNACHPIMCRDPENFQKLDEPVADTSGVFDYYVYARDQLGRNSPESCQTVLVSDSQPALSVEWNAADLKPRGSVLRTPYAVIKAKAQLSHALVDQAILEQNLQCKVSFEILGQDELAGNSVFCTEGQCRDKPMGQFVPCDKDIAFSIVQAWEQPILANSKLVLTVRADDGAGHRVESKADFWISRSTWSTEVLKLEDGPTSWIFWDYIQTRKGIPLALFKDSSGFTGRLARFVDSRWQIMSSMSDLRFFIGADGSNSAKVSYRDNDGTYRNEFWEFDDDGNIRNNLDIQKSGFPSDCGRFMVDAQKRLWCSASDNISQIFYFDGHTWASVPDLNGKESIRDWHVDAQGNLWLVGGHTIAKYEFGKSWKHWNLRPDEPAEEWNHIIEDRLGRIWLLTMDSIELINKNLFLFHGEELQKYASSRPLDGRLFPIMGNRKLPVLDQVQIGTQTFHFASDIWTDSGHLFNAERLGRSINYQFDSGEGIVALEDHGFIGPGHDGEAVYWPTKILGFKGPNYSWGRSVGADTYFVARFGDSELWQMVRIRTNRSSLFGADMIPFQGRYSMDNWTDPEGRVVYSMPDGVLLRFDGNVIERLSAPLPLSTLRVYPLAGNRYCAWAGDSVIVAAANSPIRQIYTDKVHTGFYDCFEAADGSFWFTTPSGIGYAIGENAFHTVFASQSEDTGYWQNMYPIGHGKKVIAAWSKVLRVISTGTEESKDFWFQQAFPNLKIASPVLTSRLSDADFLISFTDESGKPHVFLFNSDEETFTSDPDLERLMGDQARSCKYIGSTSWCYISDGMLIRKNGIWSIIPDAELNPWPGIKGGSYAPDSLGRIWFLNSNNEFQRYDP